MGVFYQRFAGSTAAAPVIFLILFPGYFDGMLTEDPNAPKKEENRHDPD